MMVLGACLAWPGVTELFVAERLHESHFFSAHHRAIWRRLHQAAREGLEAQQATVRMLLAKHGELEDVGAGYLLKLMDGMPRVRTDGARALARRLVECAVGREAIAVLRKAQQQLEAEPTSLTEGFFTRMDASLRTMSAQLAGRRMPDHVKHVGEVLVEVVDALKAGPPEFIDTPWPALTSMLGGGIGPGELVYLGARPGFGKTAMALEIARRSGRQGRSVFIVSREMLRVAIGTRMIAQEGQVNATWLRKRELTDENWWRINQAVEQLAQMPVWLTHEKLTIDDIRRIVGIMVDDGALSLLIVDYLQLIDAPPNINERRLQVEAVSKGLKAITIDYGVPVLCLSSLSRPPDGKAPTLSSLRESGNLEHDADTVFFLHRPHELEPLTDCIVAKSRHGRTGRLELTFRGEFLWFEELWQGGPDDQERRSA